MHIEVPDEVIVDNLYINLVVGPDLFEQLVARFGKAGWNAYVLKLRPYSIWSLCPPSDRTALDNHCRPAYIEIDLRGACFQGSDLSGLDLAIPRMDGCNFEGTDLSGSDIGFAARATFRSAKLREARFEGDISGCDFTDADLSGTSFELAMYHRQTPPVGLPASKLKSCGPLPRGLLDDENPPQDRSLSRLEVKSAELRSFWGDLT